MLVKDLFSASEISLIKTQTEKVLSEKTRRKILGKSGVADHFCTGENVPFFELICRLNRIVQRAQTLLGNRVYVHQSKCQAGFCRRLLGFGINIILIAILKMESLHQMC